MPRAEASIDLYATAHGRRTRYRVQGSGSPVLLIHGIGRSLDDFADAAPLLAANHTVYSVDLAGYGDSDRLRERTNLDSLARSVLTFLDTIGENRPLRLVGNSLGGAVSMQIAALAPDRVAALVLVDAAGFGTEVTPALRLVSLPVIGRLVLTRPSRKTAEQTVRAIVYDKSFATEERIDDAFRLSRTRGHASAMAETARSLGTWGGIRPEWRRDLLARVTRLRMPVLLIWGDKDRILPFDQLDAAREAFPDARVHVFERTGHMPQIEHAAEFADVVSGFLAETAP